jgi:hypothetical protein
MDDAKFDAILADIAVHGNAARAIRAHKGNKPAFYARIATDESARARYVEAKATGCHAYADETLELQQRKPPKIATQFGEKVDNGWVQWQRNVVDARKWHLAHLLPKVYGERTVLAGDPDNPLAIVDADAATVRSKLLSGVAAAGATAAPGEPEQ